MPPEREGRLSLAAGGGTVRRADWIIVFAAAAAIGAFLAAATGHYVPL